MNSRPVSFASTTFLCAVLTVSFMDARSLAGIKFDAARGIDFPPGSASVDSPTFVADVNEDGHVDVVAFDLTSMSVFFGDGAGSFTPGPVGPPPYSSTHLVVSSDVDRDGHVDFVVTTHSEMSVRRGNGTGHFTTGWSTPIPSGVFGLEASDVNDDAIPDLLLDDGDVHVFVGDGLGGFVPTFFDRPRPGATASTAVDLDLDGVPDLVTAGVFDCGFSHGGCASLEVIAYRGNGDGTFGASQSLSLVHDEGGSISGFRSSAPRLAVGDFDEDGIADVVVSSTGIDLGAAMVLMGDGSLGVRRTQVVGPSLDAVAVRATDVNHDGNLDIVALTRSSEPPLGAQLTVFLGGGGGSFPTVRSVRTAGGVLHVADVDEDGNLDAVVRGHSSVALHLGDGSGGFLGSEQFAPVLQSSDTFGPFMVDAADFDEDGKPDVVTWTQDSIRRSFVSVLTSDGRGGFRSPIMFPGRVRNAKVADFDEDGHADLVGFDDSYYVQVFLGDGQGGIARSDRTSFVANPTQTNVAIDDFDGDGHADFAIYRQNLLTEPGSVYIGLGNGDATFRSAPSLQLIEGLASTGMLATGDFDRDGLPDLLCYAPPRVFVLRGHGDGSFDSPPPAASLTTIDWLSRSFDPAVVDLDRDGRLDVVLPDPVQGVVVLLGNGDGSFAEPRTFPSLSPAGDIALADFDGDERLDVAIAYAENTPFFYFYRTTVRVASGDGAGNFGSPRLLVSGEFPIAIAAADFDRDGDPDLAVANGEGAITLISNRSIALDLECRRGNVNVRSGPPVDVLLVNGTAGVGVRRRVVVPVNSPLEMRLDAPPSQETSRYVVWDWASAPTPRTIDRLPGVLGYVAMPTPLSPTRSPQPRFIVNTTGSPRVGATRWPVPVTVAPTTLLNLPQGVRRQGTFYLQGWIEDGSGPNGRSAVTNGVEVEIR